MASPESTRPLQGQEDDNSRTFSPGGQEITTKRPLSIALSRSESRRLPSSDTKMQSQDETIILEQAEIARLGKSSTSHLQALSKLAKEGADADFSIHSPDQAVTGLHGRRRFQRNLPSSGRKSGLPGYGGRTWMDQQRQFLQAYEYLCHIGEAKEWIEDVIHKTIAPIVELEEALRDGVTLAEIVQTLYPDRNFRIFRHDRLQFRHSDNIAIFFRFLAEIQLPDLFRFELVDLYEKKNIPKVIYCIHALSWLLYREGMVSFRIGNLVGQLEFEHHELEQVQKGLDKAGVSMPNFSGMGESFGAAPEPEPVETEQDRMDRLLNDQRSCIVDLQAQLRGTLVRLRLGATMTTLWEDEELLIDLQARIRGDWARQISDYRLSRKQFAERLQSAAKGFIVRTRHREREQHWETQSRDVVLLQSVIRGGKARGELTCIKSQLQAFHIGTSELQAAVRGALSRWLLGDCMAEMWQAESSVLQLQARLRGSMQRRNHHRQRQDGKRAEVGIKQFQALARAVVVRRRIDTVLRSVGSHEQDIIRLQAFTRAFLERQRGHAMASTLEMLQPLWLKLQARCRGHLSRHEHRENHNHLKGQVSTIVQLQALSRAMQQRRSIKSIHKTFSNHHEPVSDLQAAIRGFLARDRLGVQLHHLRREILPIRALQSSLRGYLQRQALYDQLCAMNVHEEKIIQVQALIRAVQQRFRITDVLDSLDDVEGTIIDLQAAIRGNCVRERFAAKKRHFEENMKKVIKIQSFVRARQQGEAYKSLTSGKNPPVGAVKNFVHLLNDSDFDFEEEMGEFEAIFFFISKY